MNQVSTEPKDGSKFWVPRPGEEVFFRPLNGGRPAFTHVMGKAHGDAIPCTSEGTFETAHQCFGCKIHTGVFVAALMTLFLEGVEAARRYYRDPRS